MRDEIYKDFHIPLSELRKQWKRAIYNIKDNIESTEPEIAIRHYVERRKRKYLEDKLRGK